MKKATLQTLLCACCLFMAADAAQMASEPWVTNRIAEAIRDLPAPGNYHVVSNAAMNAAQKAFLKTPMKPNGLWRITFFDDVLYPGWFDVPMEIDNSWAFLPDGDASMEYEAPGLYVGIPFNIAASRAWTSNQVAAAVTAANNYTDAAIRERSLGGIWDEALQVWWTPVMRNGSLTYQATTNVNLNAEN
ncbi:MAG: hypothetical protein J6Z49_06955 [Kiritimatiellae bacterium]|nr:hypothetical protein [Kiritimatiellia bacterium]